jgi:hypothetical protein
MEENLFEAIIEIEDLKKRYNLRAEQVLVLEVLKICEINKLGYKEAVEEFTKNQSNNDNNKEILKGGDS